MVVSRAKHPRTEAAERFIRHAKSKGYSEQSVVHEIQTFLKKEIRSKVLRHKRFRAIRDFLKGKRQLKRMPHGRGRYQIQEDLVQFCRIRLNLDVLDTEFDTTTGPPDPAAHFIASRHIFRQIDHSCGDYIAFSPKGDWLAAKSTKQPLKSPDLEALRQIDVKIFSGGSSRYFFELGKRRCDKGEAKTYFSGEVFTASDRLFLLGYDMIEPSDILLLTLLDQRDRLFGIETISISNRIGARRVVLRRLREDGSPVPLDQTLLNWLTGSTETVGVLADVPHRDEKAD